MHAEAHEISAKTAHTFKPFIENKQVSLGIFEGLFTYVFDTPEFRAWFRRHCTWQLRIIGPPGSGKTTFAALTLKFLKESFRIKNVGLASIFLNRQRGIDDESLLRNVLISILQQLSRKSIDNAEPSPSVEDLRKKLHTCVASLGGAYLVIDDLDVCSQPVLDMLESELVILQRHGLNVMITSRIPLHHDLRIFTCDVETCGEECSIYWSCKTCNGEADQNDGLWSICQSCYDTGIQCPSCNNSNHLHEPYPCINLYLRGILGRSQDFFSEFVAQALEVAHGDLGINSKFNPKPPSSALGGALTSAQAEQKVNEICKEALCNVLIAKLRLDLYQAARTTEELVQIGDRLPDNFLTIFDAGIDQILLQNDEDRRLGLCAIIAAVLDENGDPLDYPQSFDELEQRLQAHGVLGTEPPDTRHYNLNRVLRSTCGFLWIETTDPMTIEVYHRIFGMYVSENYHDELFGARIAMQSKAPGRKRQNYTYPEVPPERVCGVACR